MKKHFLVITLIISSFMAFGDNVKDSYMKDLDAFKDHQFDKNQIKSFVYYWFSLHDVHADINKSYALLDKDNLYMKFPEITVKNLDDYKKWYDGVGTNIKSNLHYVKKLEVTFAGANKYTVNILVNWQAIDKDGKFIDMDATQEWTLVDPPSKDITHPLVQKYLVLGFKDNSVGK
ncbi:MAG: hypothetical protein WCR55_03835 [Lentisphaerota bacterium]